MKILFYGEMVESLGIEYLSAALRMRGHETRLVFRPRLFDNHALTLPWIEKRLGLGAEWVLSAVARSGADLVAFSCNVANFQSLLLLARAVKDRLNLPVVIGGPLATSAPEMVLKRGAFDYLVEGEGEDAICELVEALEKGRDPSSIPNIWTWKKGVITRSPPRPLVENLDSIPWPDRDLFARDGYLFGMISASRGCPFSCTFCATGNVLKSKAPNANRWYRLRKPLEVVKEAADARTRYKIEVFHFGDDVFPINLSWLGEFAPQWRRDVGVPFDINVEPRRMTPKVLKLLVEAGCSQVSIGLESADPHVARTLMNRNFDPMTVAEMVRLLRLHGIVPLVDILFGVPGEKPEQMIRSADWALNNLKGAGFHTFVYMPLPGTPMEKTAVSEGMLNSHWTNALNNVKLNWTNMLDDVKLEGCGEPLFRRSDLYVAKNLAILLPLMDNFPSPLKRFIRMAKFRELTPIISLLSMASMAKLDRSARLSYIKMYKKLLPAMLIEKFLGSHTHKSG